MRAGMVITDSPETLDFTASRHFQCNDFLDYLEKIFGSEDVRLFTYYKALKTCGYLNMNSTLEFEINSGYVPGTIGRIAELHSTYYYEYWQFGLYFEAKVATELSEFLQRYDKSRDGIWIATVNSRVEGSVVIDGIRAETEGAHLRWFIMSHALRGKGVGRKLINRAIDFCKIKGYKKIYLWTFEGLNAARHLYEDVGFKLIKQQSGVQWGTTVNEQYFELRN